MINSNRQLTQFINKKESMVTKKNRIWAMLALVVAFAGLSSCLKNNTTPQKPYTTLWFIGGVPTTYAADIYINDAKAASNFGYAIAGGFTYENPGSFRVDFKKAGGDSLLATTTGIYDTLDYHTHILYGQSPIDVYTIDEAYTFDELSTEKSNVRFFNLSPDLGPVDFYINDTKVSSSRQNMDFLGGVYDSFVPTDAGTVTVRAKAAGTDTEIAVKTDVQLGRGYPHTLFLVGLEGNTGDFKPKIAITNH